MIDAEGVEALSMRKLASVLGRDPMRLYRHTDSRAALLDSVADLVLEELVVTPAFEGDWEAALRAAADSFCTIVLAHPRMVLRLVDLPSATPPGSLSPARLRWLEGLLGLLADAGFDATGALSAYRFFTGFLAGHALQEVKTSGDHPDDADLVGLNLLSDRQFPRIRALAPVLAAHDSVLALALGLDLVLIGLRSQLDAITHPRQLSK